ncbi:MAG: methylmalonyl Co-A mutase-associated GTPase MeaB [Salinirussus sp.]
MTEDLVARLLDGDHRALARAISTVENRRPGYRDLVSELHGYAGEGDVIGVTGSPGAGKSTLVDKLAAAYRDRGLTVGIIAIDPASPFTGGAVLGDRIRMGSNVGDMDVFVRSMSARGSLGGLSTATADAVTALDAFGKDKILIETVGAGQNEIDIVKTADTVAVLVPPGSGDDVQMLKAGILEIADVFVVNKADVEGADRTVQQLREMLEYGRDAGPRDTGHHGPEALADGATTEAAADEDEWRPPIVETVATRGEGVETFVDALDDHRAYLDESGRLAAVERTRYAEQIRTLLREDAGELLEDEIDRRGGLDTFVERVRSRETDPYTVADELIGPLRDCLDPD